MKRAAIILVVTVAFTSIVRGTYETIVPAKAPLSRYVPAGPLLYLEAKDFSAFLADWNAFPEKSIWAESSNYEVFSRSRLFLRLKGAGDQFAAAAGLPPDMDFLSQIAGTHSALALYDIGNLQFLYITYLPSARSMQTKLWQTRSSFEPRNAGGVNFYLRRDPESQREVAFAVAGDYLLLATREDLLAGALRLMTGNQDRTVESEPWWSQSVSSAGQAGDLRMVLNLDKIVPSSYFRTYWIQQNITDMKQYSAAVSDLFRSGKEYREERVLIAKTPSFPSSNAETAVADLAHLIPENSGLYKVEVSPTSEACFHLLETKFLAPHSGEAPDSKIAPQVQLTSGETGESADLETRIDQAPPEQSTADQGRTELQKLLSGTHILASLEVQFTGQDRGGVFVKTHSVVVLKTESDWNAGQVQTAISEFLNPNVTASELGLGWEQKSGYQQLDGLWPISFAVHGPYLLVSDSPAVMEAMLSNLNQPRASGPAVLIAGFNLQSESQNFTRFSSVVDRNNDQQNSGTNREPEFFSENLSSLGQVLGRVKSEKIKVRIDGNKILQTVTYELKE